MKVSVGQKFKLPLQVRNAENYFQSGAMIAWTADKMQFRGISAGDLLGSVATFHAGQKQVIEIGAEKKDAVVFVYTAQVGTTPAQKDAGTVAMLEFTALAAGVVKFMFVNPQVRNADLQVVQSQWQEFDFEQMATQEVNIHYFEIEIVQ